MCCPSSFIHLHAKKWWNLVFKLEKGQIRHHHWQMAADKIFISSLIDCSRVFDRLFQWITSWPPFVPLVSFLPQSRRRSTPTWILPRPSWSKESRWPWTAPCKEWSWCIFSGISPTEMWVGAEQNKCFCSRALWGFVSWAQMNPRCWDTPYFHTIAWSAHL